SRARRCVEACVYGTLDFVGYPRFPAPVEFIAAVIAYYVHPVNRSRKADRKSGSAGMPRPISYAVFCLKKKKNNDKEARHWPSKHDVTSATQHTLNHR